jgi:hypothetical protein
MPTFGPEHDKMWARWALDILSKSMLYKGYDGVNALRWNFEVEPFVV